MKKLIFSLLALAAFGCQSGASDMHFGPGPDDESSAGAVEDCSSCGRVHG